MKWLIRLFAAALVAAVLVTGNPIATDFPNIPKAVIAETWSEAAVLCEAPDGWLPPEAVIHDPVVRTKGRMRLLGNYFAVAGLDKKGRPLIEERVYVYIPAVEAAIEQELFKRVLVHEFLHSCWYRRATTDPTFYLAHPDSELYVETTMGEFSD